MENYDFRYYFRIHISSKYTGYQQQSQSLSTTATAKTIGATKTGRQVHPSYLGEIILNNLIACSVHILGKYLIKVRVGLLYYTSFDFLRCSMNHAEEDTIHLSVSVELYYISFDFLECSMNHAEEDAIFFSASLELGRIVLDFVHKV